ncbi:hypothetical protein HYE68_007112 [Fusarium pseudograminearum]|uniref:Uncharacterized protein n=1 Tax=Fusarium pseudograminearum (strain CS3096) TaxID=1028729 RepID=K3W0N0_FUSPC|nr:hypothetical protein FPSE_05400 [Fusarium pseudograminearum CS3096]EKJ74435.1 hypothetical protein FPSE_05400 [Fusarium pseudograminearum CS3096]QPC76360.1 hypothetical protein HYE68_007112 [Fusarium pseudograminearum]
MDSSDTFLAIHMMYGQEVQILTRHNGLMRALPPRSRPPVQKVASTGLIETHRPLFAACGPRGSWPRV